MSENRRENFIPNSTQIPNVMLDFLMAGMPEAELKCLLYVCRRTFGFGKKADRIGLSQFTQGIKAKATGQPIELGTGLSRRTVMRALENLVQAQLVAKVKGKQGGVNGYRMNLEIDPAIVMQAVASFKKAQSAERSKERARPRLFPLGSVRADTSATPDTRASASTDTGGSVPADTHKTKGNKEKESNTPPAKAVGRSDLNLTKPHNAFEAFISWYQTKATQIRGLRVPLLVSGVGKRNFGRFLSTQRPDMDLMEQLAIYFLAHPYYRDRFGPGLETFVSTGIMNALLNDMSNRPTFWKDLDSYTSRFIPRSIPAPVAASRDMQAAMRALVERMALPK